MATSSLSGSDRTTSPSSTTLSSTSSSGSSSTSSNTIDLGVVGGSANPPILNPLNRYPSYTYSWSLWWLDVSDFNKLMVNPDVSNALAWNPGNLSGVIAEDGGRYIDQRLPATLGYNYNIQDVQFKTTLGLSAISKSSNSVGGSLTVVEPYGITFIDSLVAASAAFNLPGIIADNYLDRPYMLQLDFKAYAENGSIVDTSKDFINMRKRFPIRFTGIKMEFGNTGTEYKISFVPTGLSVYHDDELRTIPTPMNIIAGTVGEFFNGPNGFREQLKSYFANQVITNKSGWGNSLDFDIDPAFVNSPIVYDKELTYLQTNPTSVKLDVKTRTFSIDVGADILEIINRVMAHSDYLVNLQLGLETNKTAVANESQTSQSQASAFNSFKTMTRMMYAGIDGKKNSSPYVFDASNNRYAKTITYYVRRYASWFHSHPNLPLLADPRPFTVKQYNYLYTGQNTDILDLKLNFNTTWYTAYLAYKYDYSAKTQIDQDADAVVSADNLPQVTLSIPTIAKVLPMLSQVQNPTPLRFRPMVNVPDITTGMGIFERPGAQVALDVIKSLQGKLDKDAAMVTVDLTINGDPTLIRQDDWLYVASPTNATDYNTPMSNYDFAMKYGHIKMETGQIPVSLNFNSPIDIDTDVYNKGLTYPDVSAPGNASTFSGSYNILTIDNQFRNGEFRQVLKLARHMNSNIVTDSAPAADRSAASVNRANQSSTSGVNTSTPPITPSTLHK